jgi:hypothetical protein
VVEEQAGVEVVVQVHPQLRRALLDREEFALRAGAAVLAAALAALARLHHHLLARQLEHFVQRPRAVAEAALAVGFRDAVRRGVFLHVQEQAPVACGFLVGIHRRRVLGRSASYTRQQEMSLRARQVFRRLRFFCRRLATMRRALRQRRRRPRRALGRRTGSHTSSVHSSAPLNTV